MEKSCNFPDAVKANMAFGGGTRLISVDRDELQLLDIKHQSKLSSDISNNILIVNIENEDHCSLV